MAGKQVPGDGLSSSLAGMSKNQLYDIMCQMKVKIYPYIPVHVFLCFFSGCFVKFNPTGIFFQLLHRY